MSTYALTKRQHECLSFIEDYITTKGFSPSYEEAMDNLGLASKSGVHRLITALVERGHLVRLKNKARSLTLVSEAATSGLNIHTKHIPPTINKCYRNHNVKGRVKTKAYKQWEKAAAWDMNGKGSITGPYTITITIDRQCRHPLADIMNREKVVSDLLKKQGVIEDDKFCESGTVRWGDADGGMTIHIEPYLGNVRAA